MLSERKIESLKWFDMVCKMLLEENVIILEILEKMFYELLSDLPAITFLARMNRKIVGVMRMKTCKHLYLDTFRWLPMGQRMSGRN